MVAIVRRGAIKVLDCGLFRTHAQTSTFPVWEAANQRDIACFAAINLTDN